MPTSIADLLARLRRDHARLGIKLYPPAPEEELLALENRKGVKLPADLRAFYCFCDGFESAEDLFRIIPLGEIPAVDAHLVSPRDFHLAEYLMYCDMWTLAINPLHSASYTIYNLAGSPITLTTSFAEFLEVFLDNGVFGVNGLYDWAERLTPLPASPPPTLPNPAPPTTAPPHKPWYKFW